MSLLRCAPGLHSASSNCKQLGCGQGRPASASTWRAPHRGAWQQGGAGRCGFRCQASKAGVQANIQAADLAPALDAQTGAGACFDFTEKLCEGCKVVRSLVEFGQLTCTVDGHHYLCRTCIAERMAVRYPDKKDIPHPKGPKRCRMCGLTKAGRDFSKNRTRKDGLATECRACRAEFSAAYIASSRARINLVASKTCADCGKHKAAADFHQHCVSLDGLGPRCKGCESERARERRQQRTKTTQAPVTTRKCTRCKVLKPASAFYAAVSGDGLTTSCKECSAAVALEPTVETKTCSKCHAEKPAAEFARLKSNKTGLASACKACANAPRALEPTVAEKQCTACGATKPAAKFSRAISHRTGLQPHCKACVNAPRSLHPMVAEKLCKGCGVTKHASAFYRQVASRDGLSAKCKECRNAVRRSATKLQGPGSLSNRAVNDVV